MAYTGGVYTQPITTKSEKIAQFYLNGMMNVNQIRMQVQKQRQEELSELTKATSGIVATGVAEFDKLYTAGGRSLVSEAYKYHDMNRRGLISRSEATAGISNLTSQGNQFANVSKFVQEKTKEYDKLIAEEKILPISKDEFLRGFLANTPKQKFITDRNGNQYEYEDTYGVGMIGTDLSFIRNFQYIDDDGEIKTQTQTRSLPNIYSGQEGKYFTINIDDKVKDFVKTIGKDLAFPYNQYQDLDGSKIFQAVRDQGEIPALRNTVENTIDSFVSNDDNVISILAQYFGAAAYGDSSYRQKTDKEIQQIYGSFTFKDKDGVEDTRPKYYDKNGDGIVPDKKGETIIDPTVIRLNEKGQSVVTDKQRELVSAFMRDRYLQGLNVDYREYWDRGGAGSTPGQMDIKAVRAQTFVSPNVPGSVPLSPGVNQGDYNETALTNELILGIDASSKSIDANSKLFEDNLKVHQRGAKIETTNYSDQLSNMPMYNQRELITGAVTFQAGKGTAKKPGELKDVVLKNMTNNTINGRELATVTGLIYFDAGIGADEKRYPARIVIKGTSKYASTSSEVGGMVGAAEVGLQAERQLMAYDFVDVSLEEAPNAFQNFWDNNIGDFKTLLQGMGYKADGSQNGVKNQHFKAFKDFAENY